MKAPSRSASVSRSREGSHSASTSSYSIHVQANRKVLKEVEVQKVFRALLSRLQGLSEMSLK